MKCHTQFFTVRVEENSLNLKFSALILLKLQVFKGAEGLKNPPTGLNRVKIKKNITAILRLNKLMLDMFAKNI